MTLFLKRPYILALLIAVALGAWLFSGQAKVEQQSEAQKQQTVEEAQPSVIQVRVREQKAQPLRREIILTGRTAPLRTVLLRAETDARVIQIGAVRGARVKKGSLIIRLATDDRALRVKEAQALVKQREFEYKAMQRLSKKGYQSQTKIAEALTLLESAKTQVKQANIALSNTVIRAPFKSVLVERQIELGDYVSTGDIVAELMDEDPFLVVGEISERQHHQLKLGATAKIRLITGQTITGKITLISARAIASTRTFDIEIQVSNPKGKIAAGMTCEIRIPLEKAYAHKVSSALLSLNDEGILGVKTVNDDNRVIFYPAKFVRATAEGIWLTGLPKQLRFITVGQGFVRPGDLVQPVLESEIALKST
ncbi:MAG TPA: efflux RND transporter periplasmic adaptor subunit [Thiotrichaceae bacterium]|nr:efflux RND transporter periplasmic adaptor subunit [Thiotrichaceae bacterium]